MTHLPVRARIAAAWGMLFALAAPAAQADVRAWTAPLPADVTQVPAEGRTLGTVRIAAARNGAFSGQVVLESAAPIRGVRAALGPLSGPGGRMPAEAVRLRFATPFETGGRGAQGPDVLLDATPEATSASGRAGHLLPVWITVTPPSNTPAGVYAGELSVQAEGLPATKVPVSVAVADWTLPDPQAYRAWCDIVTSPDTLAVEYAVPLWSPRHWDLIARSFRLIAGTGSRTLYLPLIARTNIGNEESLVRWIPKGDRYEFDFTVLDRYLDVAQQNLGTPKMTILWAWDICMSQRALQRGLPGDQQGQRTRENREELLGKGPRVTSLDPKTGATDVLFLPRYAEPKGKAAWRPLAAELRRRLAARGLEKTMLLGMVSDLQPDKDDAEALKDIWGGLPWAAQCHPALLRGKPPRDNNVVQGVADIGYVAHVYAISFQVNPALGRLYGWRSPQFAAHYYRGYELLGPPLEVRLHPEFAITGGQRGVGRIPADFWPVLKDARDRRMGRVQDRYPENLWRNLDISTWFLAPGPDGPAATVRLEQLREGLQECEARIFIEDALLNPATKARLGADLADRAQALLDERQIGQWRTVWNHEADLRKVGNSNTGRNPEEGLWKALQEQDSSLPAFYNGEARTRRAASQREGAQWWLANWPDPAARLFAMAGEVRRRLGP